MHLTVITGSQGFLGRHLVRALVQARVEILGVGRGAPSAPALFGGRYHRCDLARPEQLLPEDHAGRPFTLVHLAWDTSRPAQFWPHADHLQRLAGLLDYWRSRGLRSVVMPGTAEEYGRRGGRLREDDSPLEPISPYGWGKSAARGLLRNWSRVHQIPVVWLRPFIVYGPGQTGSMVLPYALRQWLAGAPAEFSDGRQQRDFVYVDDAIEAFRAATRWDGTGFQVFNIGTGEPVRVRDLLEYVADLLGARGCFRFNVLPRRPGEPSVQVADPSHANGVLGWTARVQWREGLRRTCAPLIKATRWAA